MLDIRATRSLLRRTRPRRNADGYPNEVRSQVVTLARDLVDDGHAVHAIALELGIQGNTLKRWLASTADEAAGFLPVAISAPESAATTSKPTIERPHDQIVSSALALISPTGFRLEGLCLDDAITLLRRMS